MKLTNINPRYTPTIPIIPASAGGAGKGKLRNVTIAPKTNPTIKLSRSSISF